MAESPLIDSDAVIRVSVTCDGAPLDAAAELISVTVRREINMVPSARLVLADGDMPDAKFPLSDEATFAPGAAITIAAGYGDEEKTIFEGIVVRHGVHVTGNNDARLIVECRDKAVKMTLGRRNANHVDKKDSDILQALAGAHGLSADVEATSIQHKSMVQHYCSDWDFALARAEANGMVVTPKDGSFVVKAPDAAAEAVLKVTYGIDIVEFHADMDARTQFAKAKGTAWDPKTQAVVAGSEADPAALTAQGNLSGATLAGVGAAGTLRLQTPVASTADVLTAWAKAAQLKAGLARIRGHVRFQGSALALPGSVLELAGVGDRFNGKVLMTAVEHRIVDGNWTTDAGFGHDPNWFAERTDIVAPSAAGLLPGVEGLYIGKVKKLDADPEGENRIQVSVPVLETETDGIWARLMQPYASNAFGAFWLPEVGDEVVLGFFANDPVHPVVLGSLYSSKLAPPYALAAENDTKAFVTRTKLKIEFDEKKKVITLTTPGTNKIVLSDDDKSILLSDQNGNTVKLSDTGIALDTPKDVKITAKGKVTIDAVGEVGITSKADVKSAGLNVACEAQVGFTGKGNATAELSASGQTTVKGAMVMIN